jgi:hypothetical protein
MNFLNCPVYGRKGYAQGVDKGNELKRMKITVSLNMGRIRVIM